MYFHSHKIHFEPLIIVCLIWFWYSMCILKVSSAHIAYTFFLLSPKSLGGLSGPSFHSPSHNGWEYEKEKKKKQCGIEWYVSLVSSIVIRLTHCSNQLHGVISKMKPECQNIIKPSKMLDSRDQWLLHQLFRTSAWFTRVILSQESLKV